MMQKLQMKIKRSFDENDVDTSGSVAIKPNTLKQSALGGDEETK